MAAYYIHIADPAFGGADSDFPFGFRLGPYNTKAEALAQAVSDLAGGQTAEANLIGIYAERDSEAQRHGESRESAVSVSDLKKGADAERKRRDDQRRTQQAIAAPDIAEMWDALEGQIKDPAVLEIARFLRGRTM